MNSREGGGGRSSPCILRQTLRWLDYIKGRRPWVQFNCTWNNEILFPVWWILIPRHRCGECITWLGVYMCVYIYICMQHLEENCYCGGIEAPLLLDRIKRYLENYFSLFVPFRSLPFRVVGIDFERGKILETILLPFSFKCLLKRKNCLSSSFFPLSNKNLEQKFVFPEKLFNFD